MDKPKRERLRKALSYWSKDEVCRVVGSVKLTAGDLLFLLNAADECVELQSVCLCEKLQ